jgi:hypothetical protein
MQDAERKRQNAECKMQDANAEQYRMQDADAEGKMQKAERRTL